MAQLPGTKIDSSMLREVVRGVCPVQSARTVRIWEDDLVGGTKLNFPYAITAYLCIVPTNSQLAENKVE